MKKFALTIAIAAMFVGCSSKDSPAVTMCKQNCIDKLQACAAGGKDNQKSCEYAYEQCLKFCTSNN